MIESIILGAIGFVTATVTGLVSWAVARRRSSGTIATSDAASLWTESTQMRQDLRREVEGLRRELRETVDKLDAAIAQLVIANEAAAAAREETRIARDETAALREEIKNIHDEVRTSNALTMGAMADNQESRRILAIPTEQRTDAEVEHLETAGIQARSDRKERE